jgi:hypothetical protein
MKKPGVEVGLFVARIDAFESRFGSPISNQQAVRPLVPHQDEHGSVSRVPANQAISAARVAADV